MMDLFHDIMSHSSFDPTDPQVQAENASERLHRSQDRVLRDEDMRKRMMEDSRIDRLPYWLHPEADYLSEDSGITNGDKEL